MLEAMTDNNGLFVMNARAALEPMPTVFCTFFFPNGINPGSFYPAGDGPDYALTSYLASLEPFKDDFAFIRGLYKPEYNEISGPGGDAHTRGHCTFSTAHGTGQAGAHGPSLDWVMADEEGLGLETKFKVLPVAAGSVGNPFHSYMTWNGPSSPEPSERDPQALFDRLFGDGADEGGDAEVIARRRSVLDHVSDDITRLQDQIGHHDQVRLDEHLSAIRDLEHQLDFAASCTAPEMPPTDPGGELSNERIRLLIDLQVMAFSCDLCRFGSFEMPHRGLNRQFPSLGINRGHHEISHDGTNGYSDLMKAVTDQTEQFAYMLQRMRDTPMGDSNLLYHALIMYGTEHARSEGHTVNDMFAILAGHASGRLITGHHLRFDDAFWADMQLTCFHLMGIPRAEYGNHGRNPLLGLMA
jgi:hypothetical protein